jgi:Tfp pilus assembly protein PilO
MAGRAMMKASPDKMALQAHIRLIRTGAATPLIALLFLLGVAAWGAAALNARENSMRENSVAAEPATPAAPAQESLDEQNLRQFYEALGNRSEIEQSLKTLFEIARQKGLSLDQGEYQWHFDKQSGIYRYQIELPVKGGYGAVRGFCSRVLEALPFASLDEWNIKRESAGDDAIDVRLRFTFYLKDDLTASAKTPEAAE